MSLGRRFQTAKEFMNNGNGQIDIIMFPGLDNGVQIYNNRNATNVHNTLKYDGHIAWAAQPVSVAPGSIDTTSLEQGAENRIARWRIVSQGLKLSLVNNADENDGWFECVRYTLADGQLNFTYNRRNQCMTCSGFGRVDAPTTTTDADGIFDPSQLNSLSMIQHPTYVSGKLRDIHKYNFHLKPHDTDHDFRLLKEAYPYQLPRTTTTTNETPEVRDARWNADQRREEFNNDALDHSMDVLHIRIHGRPGGTTTDDTPTRVMAHVCCNQEIMYREGSILSQMHTKK
jgi:hypothetical protein